MGFFSKIFGGESKSGIKYQQAENSRSREFAKAQSDIGRGDVNRIFPEARGYLNQGLNQAQDTLRSLPAAQIDPINQGSMQAQESILGGMDAYRAAILGLAPPPQMVRRGIDTQAALMPFQPPPAQVQTQPAQYNPPQQQYRPQDFAQMLAGFNGGDMRW